MYTEVSKTPQCIPRDVGSPGHGHCVQTALPPTFLTHHTKQEAFGGCFFVFSAVNTAAALPRSPTFANFRQGARLFQTKASGAQARSGVD